MLSRRVLLTFCGSLVLATPWGASAAAQRRKGMKPGEFTWQPDKSTEGPVAIIVSIPEQRAHVYRGGVEIGVSTCSTGRPGHSTPTGVFTILEKAREHESSLYKGAQMPNMQRLTWGGIAMHAGNLPGYPASHGCIRLPMKFSALLYEITHVGAVVIIADERTQPREVAHPGALLSDVADSEMRAIATGVSERKAHSPWEAKIIYPITSIVISRRDQKAYVTQDRALLGEYPVRIEQPERPIGTHTYSLIGATADGQRLSWLSFGLGRSRKDAHIVNWQGDAAMRRVVFQDRARALSVARTFHAGTTLLITDARAPISTRATPSNFTVMSSDENS